ncbi:hypothetical protein PENSPDRAFT_462365 [Peniophora sp. CONT]|nr:hypothetical protein PENSPDRAFT_462365 [Peniophora sp. CONT]
MLDHCKTGSIFNVVVGWRSENAKDERRTSRSNYGSARVTVIIIADAHQRPLRAACFLPPIPHFQRCLHIAEHPSPSRGQVSTVCVLFNCTRLKSALSWPFVDIPNVPQLQATLLMAPLALKTRGVFDPQYLATAIGGRGDIAKSQARSVDKVAAIAPV